MALRGIKVLEFAGLAPAPFCGLILSDHGASVTRIDKIVESTQDTLDRGKRSISINLKSPRGVEVASRLVKSHDILIDPFRRGVMESFNLSPKTCFSINKRLIYVRLSGFGHDGCLAGHAGHDINYLAISGVLSALGNKDRPSPPINLLADFAGGGLMAAFGAILALYHRNISGEGQVVDSAMTEGAAYISSFLWKSRQDKTIWPNFNERASNLLDGGYDAYQTYETKDNRWVSVGALEPQFLTALRSYIKGDQSFSEFFKAHRLEELQHIFDDASCCVQPILSLDEAPHHPHNKQRNTFQFNPIDGGFEPSPVPKLSATPTNRISLQRPVVGGDTRDVLSENGFAISEIDELSRDGVIHCASKKSAKL